MMDKERRCYTCMQVVCKCGRKEKLKMKLRIYCFACKTNVNTKEERAPRDPRKWFCSGCNAHIGTEMK